MSHDKIVEILRESDAREVIKALVSFESVIDNEEHLEIITDYYFESDSITTFLNQELVDFAEKYSKAIF